MIKVKDDHRPDKVLEILIKWLKDQSKIYDLVKHFTKHFNTILTKIELIIKLLNLQHPQKRRFIIQHKTKHLLTLNQKGKFNMNMQNDQEYDLILTFVDDGGTPEDLDSIAAVSDPEGLVTVTEIPHTETGVYSFTIRGVAAATGGTIVRVTGNDGENEIPFEEAVTVTPNLAEGVSATRSEVRNQ